MPESQQYLRRPAASCATSISRQVPDMAVREDVVVPKRSLLEDVVRPVVVVNTAAIERGLQSQELPQRHPSVLIQWCPESHPRCRSPGGRRLPPEPPSGDPGLPRPSPATAGAWGPQNDREPALVRQHPARRLQPAALAACAVSAAPRKLRSLFASASSRTRLHHLRVAGGDKCDRGRRRYIC